MDIVISSVSLFYCTTVAQNGIQSASSKLALECQMFWDKETYNLTSETNGTEVTEETPMYMYTGTFFLKCTD